MTEAEAKKKWCFESRCAGDHGNRDADGGRPKGNCLGSGCMAWRWVWVRNRGDSIPEFVQSETDGFCGRAGKL